MRLPEVLDVIEGLLVASEHPDIVRVERYGNGEEPWGPTAEASRFKTVSGVKVTHQSTATAMLWGAVFSGEIAIPVPDSMPPVHLRAQRLPVFTARLLDAARPAAFTNWQLVAHPKIGPTDAQGLAPCGVSVQCADGTKMLLCAQSTGATLGSEPAEEPFPDYVIPGGVKSWHLEVSAPAVGQG